MIPFILKTKNIGMITPQTPAIPKNVSAKSKAAATKATVLELMRSEFRLNLLTKLLFKKTKRRHTKYIYAKQKAIVLARYAKIVYINK